MPVRDKENGLENGNQEERRGRGRDAAIVKLSRRLQKLKMVADELLTERENLAKERDSLLAERENLRLSADQNVERKRADKLAADLRMIHHRTRFDQIAREKGADSEVLDDLFTLSGYTPDTDAPDDTRLTEVIDNLKASKGRWFAPAGPAKPEEPPAAADESKPKAKPEPRPAVGSGRAGGGTGPGPDWVRVSEMQDPVKVFGEGGRAFQKRYAEAAKQKHIIYDNNPEVITGPG